MVCLSGAWPGTRDLSSQGFLSGTSGSVSPSMSLISGCCLYHLPGSPLALTMRRAFGACPDQRPVWSFSFLLFLLFHSSPLHLFLLILHPLPGSPSALCSSFLSAPLLPVFHSSLLPFPSPSHPFLLHVCVSLLSTYHSSGLPRAPPCSLFPPALLRQAGARAGRTLGGPAAGGGR